jgi:type IV secretion system protein VirB2
MKSFFVKYLIFVGLIISCTLVHSADTSGSLPYETWLRTIQKSLTGPVAFSVSIIGIVSCGATLIFTGGEINRFMRSLVFIVLVMTLLVGANSFMSQVFNGATIKETTQNPELNNKRPDSLKANQEELMLFDLQQEKLSKQKLLSPNSSLGTDNISISEMLLLNEDPEKLC